MTVRGDRCRDDAGLIRALLGGARRVDRDHNPLQLRGRHLNTGRLEHLPGPERPRHILEQLALELLPTGARSGEARGELA